MELPPLHAFAAGSVALNESAWPPPEASRRAENDGPQVGGNPVIVVGGGPSGLRVAQELARRGRAVILFNAERWQPYNRVKLTPFLAGEVQIGRVYQADVFELGAPVTQYNGQTVVAIDRDGKTVENQFGRKFSYSKLVLCTGSRAHIPPIPGRELAGVYRFRNFDDVEQLVARSMRSRRTVVIGGGLLGLEAARGMARRKVETVVIEHEQHLMTRQIDGVAGRLLASSIMSMGLKVRTGCAVKTIGGRGRVEHVLLSTGEEIACDTIIICTGIRSNVELAGSAGIAVGRGITVSDTMQTSDPDVYAVGECAEYDGHVYGLVAPGLEQAQVAAEHIAGQRASYRGSVPTTKLKVIGTDVFSMGDVEQIDQRTDLRSIIWSGADSHRRIALRGLRIAGALGVGEWPEVNRIQQAVRDRALLMPWHIWRFRRTGRLYPEGKLTSVTQWPAAATVCNCTGVTRGQLGEAIGHGAGTIEALMRDTSASTVCGSCRPLLQELIGGKSAALPQPVFGRRIIAAVSLLAAMIAIAAALLPAWPYSSSVAAGPGLDRLWLDGTVKQITGFTLLGLSAFVAFLSVRKRIGWNWLGGYRVWRVLHAAVGTAALGALFMHTGFNLGQNLNRWLMLTFLAVAIAGSVTGIATAREHAVAGRGRPSRRGALAFLHILTFWPLPLLLLLHVATVYAY